MLNSLLLYSSADISSLTIDIPVIDISAMTELISNSLDDIIKTFDTMGSNIKKIGASIGTSIVNIAGSCDKYNDALKKYNDYNTQYQDALKSYNASNDKYQANLANYTDAKNKIDPLWSSYDANVAMYNKSAATYNTAVQKYQVVELELMPIIPHS